MQLDPSPVSRSGPAGLRTLALRKLKRDA